MTEKDLSKFDGEMQYALLKYFPRGKEKLEALRESVELADQAKEPYWQLLFRFLYASELSFCDDPAKIIPVAAEYAALYEEHPDAMQPKEGGQEAYLVTLELGIDAVPNLPQIPMRQWEELMERYYALVKRFNMRHRDYWHQLARFWQYIDMEKAYGYFETFWSIPKDERNKCDACDQSFAVHMSLLAGRRKEAETLAAPIKSGKLSCHDVPQAVWQDYLEDALDRGDLAEAIPYADKLYRIGDRDKSDLSYLGAVLRCWAYSNLDKAVKVVAERLEWTLGMWDQKKVYDFYKGAWVCFREFSKRQAAVELALPNEFALYQKDGVYGCAALAEWFHEQAEAIGRRFDKRNGSDYFAKNLLLACMCEGRAAEYTS